jgi:trimethylamine--corrinoid protein Co-methyltransferase
MTDGAAASATPAVALCHAPLPAAEIARLHAAALELLARRGVPVAGEVALALLRGAGAEVDSGSGRVRLPAALVGRALAGAPASFVLPGRVAERDVTVGGGPGGPSGPPRPPLPTWSRPRCSPTPCPRWPS